MTRRPPRSTRTDTLFPYTTLFRSPFHPDFVLDPYPALAEMQRIEPVFYAPMIDSWIVTRYATVRAVLQDTARFSPRIVSDPLTPLCPVARDIIVNSEFDVPGLPVNNDPPTSEERRVGQGGVRTFKSRGP